jgi:hypothetical protein
MILCRWCHGSPVHRYGLYALQWIIEINGQSTPDLETFIQVVEVRAMLCIEWAIPSLFSCLLICSSLYCCILIVRYVFTMFLYVGVN